MRDPETGNSRGFGFVSYDSFEASDAAIEVLLEYLVKLVITLWNFPTALLSSYSFVGCMLQSGNEWSVSL